MTLLFPIVYRLNFTSMHALTQGYVDESMEESIQERVAQLETWDLLLVNFPSVFFCLFAGPWSDYNGRKPLLVLPFVGNILSFLAYIVNYYFFYELNTSEQIIKFITILKS